jgi:hypothetical protein
LGNNVPGPSVPAIPYLSQCAREGRSLSLFPYGILTRFRLQINTDSGITIWLKHQDMLVARRNFSGKFERNHGDSVTGMALIVFLRGVDVGGHRTFRPSILARELSDHDVVNVGAAGTFIGYS